MGAADIHPAPEKIRPSCGRIASVELEDRHRLPNRYVDQASHGADQHAGEEQALRVHCSTCAYVHQA